MTITNRRLRQHSRFLVDQKISIIPIRCDGSKAPAYYLLEDGAWRPFQTRLASIDEINDWFPDDDDEAEYGIAIVGGQVSGELEIMDFDTYELVAPFVDRLNKSNPRLFDRLVKVMSPRPGLHCYYRLASGKTKTGKLARKRIIDGNEKANVTTLIEIKAEGGYVLAPGCPPDCHQTGRLYRRLKGPGFDEIPVLTIEEHHSLIEAARSFDEVGSKVPIRRGLPKKKVPSFFDKPWDEYNAKATWIEILEPHKWTLVSRSADGTEYFRRPGSNSKYSALADIDPPSRLRVFSENADPFESVISSRITYSKFDAFKLLNCNGNFKDALWRIQEMGYGQSTLPTFLKKPTPRAYRKPRRRSRW